MPKTRKGVGEGPQLLAGSTFLCEGNPTVYRDMIMFLLVMIGTKDDCRKPRNTGGGSQCRSSFWPAGAVTRAYHYTEYTAEADDASVRQANSGTGDGDLCIAGAPGFHYLCRLPQGNHSQTTSLPHVRTGGSISSIPARTPILGGRDPKMCTFIEGRGSSRPTSDACAMSISRGWCNSTISMTGVDDGHQLPLVSQYGTIESG